MEKWKKENNIEKCLFIREVQYTFELFLKSAEKYLIIIDSIMPKKNLSKLHSEYAKLFDPNYDSFHYFSVNKKP